MHEQIWHVINTMDLQVLFSVTVESRYGNDPTHSRFNPFCQQKLSANNTIGSGVNMFSNNDRWTITSWLFLEDMVNKFHENQDVRADAGKRSCKLSAWVA